MVGVIDRESNSTVRPEHYASDGIEPIEYINSHNFNFNLGNVVKYVSRAGRKENESAEKDLLKARQYIEFEIERIRKENVEKPQIIRVE